MPVFIVKNNPGFLKSIVLEKEDEHHLVRVMRVKAGQTLTVTDNQGQTLQTEIVSLKPLTLKTLKKETKPAPCPITVCLPLIDQTRLEWAVEKLCELNVQTVQLISTERCQFKILSAKKMERLHKIAEAAQKQCERAWPLEILGAVELQRFSFQDGVRYFVGFVPKNADTHGHTRTHTDFHRPATSDQRLVTLFIGPEGGFTDAEIDFFEQQQVQPMTVGQNVLRTETAAVVLAAVIVDRS